MILWEFLNQTMRGVGEPTAAHSNSTISPVLANTGFGSIVKKGPAEEGYRLSLEILEILNISLCTSNNFGNNGLNTEPDSDFTLS